MSNPVKELLERARSVFEDHGGAVGAMQDSDGKVCAIGALREASWMYRHETSAWWTAEMMLNRSAWSLYSLEDESRSSPAAYVNDQLGQAAVLSLYDHAIKTADDGVNP